MSELLEIPAHKENDPGGRHIAAVLNAERRAEQWAARRTLFGRIIILASLPMAYWLVRGQSIPGTETRFVTLVWAAAFVSMLACAAAGARAQWLVDKLIEEAGGRRIETEDEPI